MRYIFILWFSILFLVCRGQISITSDSIRPDSVSQKYISQSSIFSNEQPGTAHEAITKTGYTRDNWNVDKIENILLFGLLPFLLLITSLLTFLLFKIFKNNNKMEINELNEKFEKHCIYIEEKFDELRAEIINNRKYIDDKIAELFSKYDLPKHNYNSSIPLEIETSIISRQIQYAYSSMDGYFNDTFTDISNSIAYFKLELENEYGMYHLIDDQTLQKQMVTDGYPNIAPCVEEQNSRNEWISGIETIESGKIAKNERGWKIIKKTKIRYR